MKTDVTINLAGRDKVANFLISLKDNSLYEKQDKSLHKKQDKRLYTIILIAIGITIIPVLFTIIDGTFYNARLIADAAHDYGKISIYLIGLPLAIYMLTLYSGKFPFVLEQLEQNKVIIMTDNEWVDFKNSVNGKLTNSMFFLTGPYIFAFIITLYLIFKSINSPVWYSVKADSGIYIAAYLQIPVYFSTFYIFSLCIFDIIASYIILRKLFNNYNISLQPLHPDNCGGLSALGVLSKRLNLGIFLIGLISALNVYQDCILFKTPLVNPFHMAIITGYIVCAYIVFFMPLFAAHESMKQAKYDEIKRINEYFQAVNQKLTNHISSHENIDQRDMSDFENINKIYDLAKKMPVYPYNIATVSSFIGSIIIPIFLFILEHVFLKLF
jgi:hypothetical protein